MRNAAIPEVERRATSDGATEDLRLLASIQRRVLWLSTLMVHHANRIRRNSDGMKVGGHQASSASVVSILTALYFDFLRGPDRISIKPHAAPAFHACQYLLGFLEKRYLTTLRAFDGLQAYPSRTKDPDQVDFSTGSVGLGSVAPNYAALTHRYVDSHFGSDAVKPRFLSLVGDAELDEGSIWETVAEPALDALDNVIWIVDLNRQSLDRVVPGIRAHRLEAMFKANGWTVIEAKYGSALTEAFQLPGGETLRNRIDEMSNDEYQRMLRTPVEEMKDRLGGSEWELQGFLDGFQGKTLARLVADLGGHDLGVLRNCLVDADSASTPAVIFAYTIKGWGLPIAGDPLNHSALLTDEEMESLRLSLDVPRKDAFSSFPSGSDEARLIGRAADRLRAETSRPATVRCTVPEDLATSYPKVVSSQRALSMVVADLARSPRHADLAARLVTVSPDVATSTNLGGWINRRGVFSIAERRDAFSDAGPRLLRWDETPAGQHIELGISENNLFLLLGALGQSQDQLDQQLFPIGTLYDPFISRGLDALTYALYSGSRFIVLATPSGVTLSSEGGAHQSVVTPSIGLELPQITYWEPCFALEVEWILLEALRELADPAGRSSYLRLSTKPVDQAPFEVPSSPRERERLRRDVLSGAYRLIDHSGEAAYDPDTNVVTVACCGAMVTEAVSASGFLREDDVFVEVVNITSPGRLYSAYQSWVDEQLGRVSAGQQASHWTHPVLGKSTPIVTVMDGHPHTLAWIAGALGRQGVSLGVTDFGRSGTTADLYRAFKIDAEAIAAACVVALDAR